MKRETSDCRSVSPRDFGIGHFGRSVVQEQLTLFEIAHGGMANGISNTISRLRRPWRQSHLTMLRQCSLGTGPSCACRALIQPAAARRFGCP